MGFRLQTRYTIIIVGLIAVIVAILSIALTHQFKMSSRQMTLEGSDTASKYLLDQLQKRASSLVIQLNENLVNHVYLFKMEDVYYALENVRREDDVRYAHVYDTKLKIIHDGTKTIESYGKTIKHTDLAQLTLNENKLISDIRGNELIVAYPIRLGNDLLGGVVVGLSLDGIEHDIKTLKTRLSEIDEDGQQRNTLLVALLTVILTGFGILLAAVVASRLIQPIKQISRYAGQIGHGNYDVKLEINRQDEIGDLVHSLEEMRNNLKRTTKEIRHLAYHDKLTDIPNRTMFHEYLDTAVENSRRNSKMLAVLFIDIDDFKRINDNFGHHVGDGVLRVQAGRIVDSLRSADYVAISSQEEGSLAARLGGDEFIALLPLVNDTAMAAVVARRLLSAISQPIPIESIQVYVGASIGISVFPTDGNTSEELMKNADIAMYHAKTEGKNVFKYYTESMNVHALNSMQTEIELRKAMEEKQLVVYYQPQFNLATGKVAGAEALVRWNHPEHGLILPDTFISVAENTGLILELGEFVLRQALYQLKKNRSKHNKNAYVAINVSSVQLIRGNISNIIESALNDTGLKGDALHIEITESSLMRSEEIIDVTLNKLRAMGVKVWLDDFGTGYSSLGYLRRFSVNGLKVDKSFIRHMHHNVEDKTLTQAVIALAHSLGLEVVAEGVEVSEHETLLKQMECDFVQGYFYSEAIPADEYTAIFDSTIDEIKHRSKKWVTGAVQTAIKRY